MRQILSKPNIDFIGLKKYAFGLSAILVALGILTIIQILRGQANLGIDFEGGTSVLLRFSSPLSITNAREVLERNGFKSAEVQGFLGGNKILIQVKRSPLPVGEVAKTIGSLFKKELPKNPFVVESSAEIGPKVGKDLQKDAIIAVVLAFIGIIIYIALRFELKFGLAAAIATFHDVLAVLGVFYLLNKEITLLIVTALLTLAGYSLTDTVVVFDRIRENLKMRSKEKLENTINGSINEVLSRTIITSLTVFLVLIAIFFVGGEVIHDFSFALLIGVIVGTYSSIFVASPLLVVWEGKGNRTILKGTPYKRVNGKS